jgi:hypothetical protein
MMDSGLGNLNQIPQKTGNNDIGINNQQDLIVTLRRKYALKIDFSDVKSRMGDLFVSWFVLFGLKEKK